MEVNMRGRGRTKQTFICGFTTVILFTESRYLRVNNQGLQWYNEVMENIQKMQISQLFFTKQKHIIKSLFKE